MSSATSSRKSRRAPATTFPSARLRFPPLEGVESSTDVWSQAKDLRAYRVIREAELREIARAAALRGVQLRRERERLKREAAAK